MSANKELMGATVDYAKTRAVFDGYKARSTAGNILRSMRPTLKSTGRRRHLPARPCRAKLPKMDALKAEWQRLSTEKKTVYKEYRTVQKDMRELITAKSNIDHLLGLTDTQKIRKWSDSDMTQQRSEAPQLRAILGRSGRVWGWPNKQFFVV
jgi:hypothetical protein